METPKSLTRLYEVEPDISSFVRGLPSLGKNASREDGEFSPEVEKINKAFSYYGNQLYDLADERVKAMDTKSLGGGSPMKTPSFPLCKKNILELIMADDLSDYPMAAGDEYSRKQIVEYLKEEGFKSSDGIDEDNVIFTVSTTHAFHLLNDLIARPHDVILMTGPNYGLFTFVPERTSGADVEILKLSEEDNWLVNPEKLRNRIREINAELKNKYPDLDYEPKVVAFLNENPHNPLGKVMGESKSELLRQIGQVLLDEGVFAIDDLIYRDLSFERDNLSKPLASFEEFFDNTITLTGLSKAYGYASTRSGMIVAPKPIIRGIRNRIFQTMDSSPVIQGVALAGAFNNSKERKIEYKKYFDPIIEEYIYRLELLKGLINGLDSIEDIKVRTQIEKDIRKHSIDFENYMLEGIPGVDFAKGTMPESGFFALLNFDGIRNMVSPDNGRVISSEIELLKYLYEQEKIKFILGQSISWPNESELIGRVTTALPREYLVDHFNAMNKSIRKLQR